MTRRVVSVSFSRATPTASSRSLRRSEGWLGGGNGGGVHRQTSGTAGWVKK